MKLANSIKITVFSKEGEDADKIKAALISLIPFNLEQENILIGQTKAIGFNEKEIRIFEITLAKDKHINQFIETLISKLKPETKELIIRQAESRLDDEYNFFLRFDKEKLMTENIFWLTDQGNCFHIKITLLAFPKRKDVALEVVRKIFK
jgi:hypothetical protein